MSLAKQPGLGRATPIEGVRSFPAAPYAYIVYYAVRNRELIILHIRHGAREEPRSSDLI